ncbi:hypothetical protein [Nocardia sp. NPDC051833]|uniref:hypothetical protein n=1 Tax=Nocardia sp. NPDC051833 TaxID=3155674 RepID=UPI0034221D2F
MREYYFIVTLQWATRQGTQISERRGTSRISAGRSRQDAVEHLIRDVAAEAGAPANFVVLFLSLEPNEMAA